MVHNIRWMLATGPRENIKGVNVLMYGCEPYVLQFYNGLDWVDVETVDDTSHK